MTCAKRSYTAIAIIQYNLKQPSWNFTSYTKPTFGKAKHHVSFSAYSIADAKPSTVQNTMDFTLKTQKL